MKDADEIERIAAAAAMTDGLRVADRGAGWLARPKQSIDGWLTGWDARPGRRTFPSDRRVRNQWRLAACTEPGPREIGPGELVTVDMGVA